MSGLLLNDLHVVELAFLLHFILIVDKFLQLALIFRILGDLLLLLLDLRVIQCFQSLDFGIYIGSKEDKKSARL